eukprot:jgi/Mesen1/8525/ME000480S07874
MGCFNSKFEEDSSTAKALKKPPNNETSRGTTTSNPSQKPLSQSPAKSSKHPARHGSGVSLSRVASAECESPSERANSPAGNAVAPGAGDQAAASASKDDENAYDIRAASLRIKATRTGSPRHSDSSPSGRKLLKGNTRDRGSGEHSPKKSPLPQGQRAKDDGRRAGNYSTKFSQNLASPSLINDSQSSAETPTRRSGGSIERSDSAAAAAAPQRAKPAPLVWNVAKFSYQELRAGTKNFSQELIIGIGGFGKVYRGFVRMPSDPKTSNAHGSQLKSPTNRPLVEVAIKKLDANSLQGHKEWMAEVCLLGQFEHPNLVKLIGYCLDAEKRLLVYELMPNASLDRFLFNDDLPDLEWPMRIKIALGTAAGLAYLHEEVDPPVSVCASSAAAAVAAVAAAAVAPAAVIFRDFKTTNVLLDLDFTAKLSDFGLAREGPSGEETHVSTQVRGTTGYAAPEYILTGHLTPKNDVWAFGVVFLEILTGRPCLDKRRPPAEHNLIHFSKQYLRKPEKFFQIVDPRMHGEMSLEGLQRAALLARRCLLPSPSERPRMSEVVQELTDIQARFCS